VFEVRALEGLRELLYPSACAVHDDAARIPSAQRSFVGTISSLGSQENSLEVREACVHIADLWATSNRVLRCLDKSENSQKLFRK
jgi:hypothetical protein